VSSSKHIYRFAKDYTTLLSGISEIQSNLSKEVHDLRMRVETNSLRIEKCKIEGSKISKKIRLLERNFTTELSRYYINKEEGNIPFVFTAAPRNRYFAGRTKEIQELKRILKVEETSKEKKVRVAAVCVWVELVRQA
jgi:ribosome biogenesis GTPase A